MNSEQLCIYWNDSLFANDDHLENHSRINIPIKNLVANKNIFNNCLMYSNEQINNYLIALNNLSNRCKDSGINIELESMALKFLSNSYNERFMNKIKKMCKYLTNNRVVNNGDMYFSQHTYKEVIDGALIMYNVCNQIISGNIKYAYCLIRPPSHHAMINQYNGFCIVNQTFQTAQYLTSKFKNIFIFDYDVHHGDGTQHFVNMHAKKEIPDKSNIYFCSTHCYERGFYPGTGSFRESTEYVLNLPMDRFSTDSDYIEKFDNMVVPFMDNIKPDIIIVSNGFDAHKDDPMHVMELTAKYYEYVATYLKSLNIPLIYVLEGGYNPNIISSVSEKIINILIKQPQVVDTIDIMNDYIRKININE
jgi:acetoin utilization deacetylase AcuC-like enzyme